ncbi:hypothetical protein ACJ41O_014384 [Fusarium nematophilum]
MGGFVKYNDWAEKLQEIKNAEASFSNDFKQYATERGQQTLERVVKELQDTRQHQDDKECRELVAQTLPFITKQGIIDKKGGELITICCDWLFESSVFRRWQQDPAQKVLWISGDAGKGKTMMMCALIDWFQSCRGLSYFFCVETNSNLNNQVAILRGLIYTITQQIPHLFEHVRKNKDALRLEGEDVEVALFNTLKEIVEDPLMSDGVLLIDALDECRGDISRILNLIDATWSSTTKWILSSRNKMTTLEKRFGSKTGCLRLSLDESLPSEAVTKFVELKLAQFENLWKDEAPDVTTQKEIEDRLVSKSSGTYLWVALVLYDIRRDLERADPIGTVVDFIRERVERSPRSLTLMYGVMMQQLLREQDPGFYKDILKIVFTADRPLSLEELQFLANKQELRKLCSKERLRRIFLQGSSFLTIQTTL